MKNKVKSFFLRTTLIIYITSYILQYFSYITFGNKVYANNDTENEIDYTNIIAILVDNKIYNSISNEIKRYAEDYIQGTRSTYIGTTNTINIGQNTIGRNSILSSIKNTISNTKNNILSIIGLNNDTNQSGSGTTQSNTISLPTTQINKKVEALTNMSQQTTYNKYNAISNSQAIILQIDTENITAPEITKILENIYFDGIEGTSSKLIGVILIGDIPLPVVNQNGFIFPTIYPYVDFEDQKYIRDNNNQYFIYNDNEKGQAEIRHGLIQFDTIQKYKDYFEKLQTYSENPSSFIGKNIWYDDFIGNQKYFFEDGLNSYINKFLFAEDIGYNRYSNLMLSIMQGQHNETVGDTLKDLGNIFSGLNYSGNYESGLETFLSNDEQNAPTMTLKKIISEGYLNSYTSLIGTKFIDTINKNVGTANRWFESFKKSSGTDIKPSLDTHYSIIEANDEILLRNNGGLDPLIISINNLLEGLVDKKVEQEKYWLNEVIPLTYLKYESDRNRGQCVRKQYEAYENYYFGSQAKYINSMQDISSYRGTYRNYNGISGLTINDIQNSNQPSTDLNIDLNKKSIGGSYEIFSQQIDANRGYNINNTVTELNTYMENKTAAKTEFSLECEKEWLGICWSRRKWHYKTTKDRDGNTTFIPESPQDYSIRNRGGSSPLNLDSDMTNWISGYNYKNAITSVFDIGGSKALLLPETGANSYLGLNKYTNLIQRKFVVQYDGKLGRWENVSKFYFNNKNKKAPAQHGEGYDSSMGEDVKFTNYIPSFRGHDKDDPIEIWNYNPPLSGGFVDFFTKFYESGMTKTKEGNIIKLTKKGNSSICKGNGRIYTYKTLDSRVKNDATNDTQSAGGYYNAFSSKQSPIYQLHEGLLNELNNIENELANSPFNTGSEGTGIIQNLNFLKNTLYNSQHRINTILQTNKSTISGRTNEEIAAKEIEWSNAYSSTTWNDVEETVENLKGQLLEIESFFSAFSFDSLNTYISNQISNFKQNNWDLIFLTNRKSSLTNDVINIETAFTAQANKINSNIDSIESAYDDITFHLFRSNSDINDARHDLYEKLSEIKTLPTGCSGKYRNLCNILLSIRNELDNSGKHIKSKIEEIENFNIENGDDKEYYCPFGRKVGSHVGCQKLSKSDIDLTDNNNSYITSISLINDLTKRTTNDTGYKIKVDGMNITTSDRPIDSPKYLTFKGIGGDKVTFIYPDLYKVEVYTGNNNFLTLLSPEEIALNIEKYLKDVVKKYNSYLTGQQLKSNNYYNQNSAAYNTLNQLDELANPNHKGDNVRPYELFDENYLIDLLTEKMYDNTFFTGNMGGYEPIEFLAHMIYYQNITWPEKEIGETIQKDMDNIRGNFDINKKISHILNNYIIKDNNSGSFLTPGYRDDGYEVAYINSNGNDYIVYETSLPFMEAIKSSADNYKKQVSPELEKTQLEEELERDCHIPDNGEGILLFDLSNMSSPWIEAIKCRWGKLKETPMSFKFSITRGDSAFGVARNGTTGFGHTNTGWSRDSIKSQLGSAANSTLSQLGTTNIINNQNQNTLNNVNSQLYKKLNDIDNYVKIQAGKKTINADDANTLISISSSIDIGDLNFYISNIGENRIRITDGSFIISQNITQGTTGYSTGSFTTNPNNTKTIKLNIIDHTIGLNKILINICPTNNTNNCISKTLDLRIIPGEINSLEIETLGNTIIAGSQMPINIKGTDTYGNNVGELLTEKFKIATSDGTLISNSLEEKNISFSNFNESTFILNATGANLVGKTIQLTVSGTVGNKILQTSKSINVKKGKLEIKTTGAIPIRTADIISSTNRNENQLPQRPNLLSNGIQQITSGSTNQIQRDTLRSYTTTSGTTLNINSNNVGNMTIILPDENIYSYTDEFNITQADIETIPHLQLRLTDTNGNLLTNINSLISIKSKASLVKIGKITQKIINKDVDSMTLQIHQNRFSQTKSFTIQSGIVDVYLLPTFKAGNDILYLSIPGIDPIQINLNIKSGNPKSIDLAFKSDNIKKGEYLNGNLILYDNWGNIATENTQVRLGTTGPIGISGSNNSYETINISGGTHNFYINAKNQGGIGYTYAMLEGIGLNNQKAGYKKFTVQDTMLPSNNLNIMYLNLFGSDRGNQWGFFSNNNKYIQSLISNSEKLLATTTMLTSPDKIKSFMFTINHYLNISNISNSKIYLNLDNDINIGINNVGYFSIPKTSFTIKKLSLSEQNQLTGLQNIINQNNGNLIVYIPEIIDSIITGNELINNTININGNTVFNLNNGNQDLSLQINLSNETLSGYQLWDMYYDNNKIGKLLIVVKNEINSFTANTINQDYNTNEVWLGGSTNNLGLGFYDVNSIFDYSKLGYTSIQDSGDPSLGVGFTAEFKNITNFGAGQNVGESTIPYSSEFLINIGDPLLKRINDNETSKVFDNSGNVVLNTEFDKGLGELIYSDPNKNIFKVINIDFNNDDLEDILVIYSDGTIKLLKNYGGTNPFKDMGPLIVLADRIKDVVIGDVDGNGYKDLIIWTNSDILRVYHNYNGIFEVDGYPICININVHKGEISQNPSKITGLQQIFFEDMDNDGSMDIITNDSLGFIKIFYGGKNNRFNQDNYVSTDQYMCDNNWYTRLSNGAINNNSNLGNNNGGLQQNTNLNQINRNENNQLSIKGLGSNETISELGNIISGIHNTNTQGISNEVIVYRFAAKVNNSVKVLDNSYIRWKGISNQIDPEIDLETLGINSGTLNNNGINSNNFKGKKASEIKNMIGLEDKITQATNFDLNAAIEKYSVSNRYQVANFGVIPSYENGIIDENDIEYVNIGRLTGSDPIEVYKKYEDLNGDVLENGDKVEVTVTLHANKNLTGTFIDKISGPWILPIDEDFDMIQNFWFETGLSITQNKINNELEFHRDLDHNRYMIDNIGMKSGDTIKIHYRLYYENTDIVTISLDDVDQSIYQKNERTSKTSDGFIDIKTQPTDGCNPSMYVLFNNGTGSQRDYNIQYIDLGGILNETTNTAQESFNDVMSDVTNGMMSSVTDDGKVDTSAIPGMDSILETSTIIDIFSEEFSIDNILKNNGLDLSNTLDIPNQLLDALLGDITDKIESIVTAHCGGIDLGTLLGLGNGNCGLPVPFNQAFLGAGDYHLFGCFNIVPLTELIGKGMPLLNIPGNWAIPYPPGYLPAPGFFGYPFKGGTDTFSLGITGGPYPSVFRLYIMPTLTAEIGFGLCFGPYATSLAIPQPFGSVGGNCIAFTVPLPCKKKKNETTENETYHPDKLKEYADIQSCEQTTNKPTYGNGESNTCLQLASSSSESTYMTVTTPGTQNNSTAYNNGSYLGGFITIDKEPNTMIGYSSDTSPISINGEGIKLTGGTKNSNKILGSKSQGLIEKIVKGRLDKQIKYTMTNLTNFKIDVILPNFSEITAGLDSSLGNAIKSAAQGQRGSSTDKQNCDKIGGSWSSMLNQCVTQEQKCINKGKEWINGSCVEKSVKTNNEEGINSISSRLESNGLSNEKISNISETNFANPLGFLETAFENVSLIDITTQNIDIEIPMVTSDMISAYKAKSQIWLDNQYKIIKEWENLLYGLLGICGGRKINNLTDLKDAVNELKEDLIEKYQTTYKGINQEISSLKNLIANEQDPSKRSLLTNKLNEKQTILNEIIPYQRKIDALEKLNKKYDLSILNGFSIRERNDGSFLIQAGEIQIEGTIIPSDIYLLYTPTTGANASDTELTAFTQGIKLNTVKRGGKIILKSISAEGKIKTPDLGIKKIVSNEDSDACINLFLGGGFDAALNSFVSIESNANNLINAVKQNLETLDQYKKLPSKIYEWIHISDQYLGEISSFVNSFLGTLSMRMETNATRYSQYVNAIISIMTTVETYQAIINLATNWNEKCSTCSNDNYDQFTCILGLICPDGLLPTLPIPPIKIPSIYIDFSNINLGTEIKLPKFNFKTINIDLPELPNLPHPPSFNLDIDSLDDLGTNILGEFIGELFNLNGSLNLGNIPLIPEPPELPNLPELNIDAEMELPVIPPAPKIPALPNEISAIIDAAEVLEKLLCLVKKIPLVNETSLKAKIEQLSQRTYDVPYRDTFDQTLNNRGLSSISNIGNSIRNNLMPYLSIDKFKDIDIKGFDFKLETYINLQSNFDQLYDFLDVMAGEVNGYSKTAEKYIGETSNNISNRSNDLSIDLQKCISNPLENPKCFNEIGITNADILIEQYNNLKNTITSLKEKIKNEFGSIAKYKQEITDLSNSISTLQNKINEKEAQLSNYNQLFQNYQNQINSTQNIIIKNTLVIKNLAYKYNITQIEDEINELNNKIINNNKKLIILNNTQGPKIQEYDNIMESYNSFYSQYQTLTEEINSMKDLLKDSLNNISSGTNTVLDKINNLGNDLNSNINIFNQKQNYKKEQNYNNLQDLYKDLDILGYVDYNENTAIENNKILTEALNTIKGKTDDKKIINNVNSYLKLIQSDATIYANEDNINKIQSQYESLLADYKGQSQQLKELISQDYDKFLYTIANNNTKLVNNDKIDINISSKLFSMDNDVKNTLSNSENIYKMFLDYYNNNLDGYINALNNNSPSDLNMNETVYNMNKKYLYEIKEKSDIAYNIIENQGQEKVLLSQSIRPLGGNSSSNSTTSNNSSYINLSKYFDGQIISTPEGGFMLENSEYTKSFQNQSLLVDINKDNKNDLILRDNHEIFIKYRDNNSNYSNTKYNNGFYMYNISSYQQLLNNSNNGYISIHNNNSSLFNNKSIKIKLCDNNWEVKNFQYAGGDYDNINISWTNSNSLGNNSDGYLVKLIHRIDLFNDKESIINNSNKRDFDKKYIIVLPKGTNSQNKTITLENGDTINILSDNIFDINYYNENSEKINLLVTDIPRNWQYAEIYTLKQNGNNYLIDSSSSNQIVGGPQIIADNRGPNAEINFYRPSTDTIIDNGGNFEGYVSTNYTLKAYWEDNALLDSIWITDADGLILNKMENLYSKTGYIELSGLIFNEVGINHYYFVGTDINGNTSSEDVTLTIKVPNINITNIWKATNDILNNTNKVKSAPVGITAQIDHDLDEGVVQFLRERNHNREILTGVQGGIKYDKYYLTPNQTIITGQYYDFGEDIGLYLSNGKLAAKINPQNGKISIESGYEDKISIEVDFGNHYPIIKITQDNQDILMLLQLNSKELIKTTVINDLKLEKIIGNQFNEFNGGYAIIENNEILMYISPTGQIYTDHYLYGNYSFDDTKGTVIYTFKKYKNGNNLGQIEFKSKNILGK